jgi:hypothetical protein
MTTEPFDRAGAVHAEDRSLLSRLGAVAETVDPPPYLLFELGRAAFDTRLLGAELLQLLDDADQLAGVRTLDVQEHLVLYFEGADVSVDVELTGRPGSVRVTGQVMPAPSRGAVVRAESPEGDGADATVDPVGGFSLELAAPRLLRLRVELSGRVALTTPWVRP